MPNRAKVALVLAVIALVGASTLFWRKWYVGQQEPRIHSFTIQQHDEITGPHVGKSVTIEYRTIAVREDGSRANVTREPRKHWVSRELAFTSGLVQTVYDEVKAVSTIQLGADEQQRRSLTGLDSASKCVASVNEFGGFRTQESRKGIPVFKVLTSNGITLWRAPSLACATLEHFIDWDSAHPGTNTSALRVDSVAVGEPDQTLFKVPPDYVEMPPSRAKALHIRFGGAPELAVQKLIAQAAKEDEFYASHRTEELTPLGPRLKQK